MADLVLSIKIRATDETGGLIGKVAEKAEKAQRATAKRQRGLIDRVTRSAMAAETLGRSAEDVLGTALKSSADYADRISNVATLVDDATFSTAQLREITDAAAKQFGTFPQAQADALYQVISTGATTAAEAQDRLMVANKLAIAGLADVDKSVLALSKTSAIFGASNTEAADALQSVVRIGATDLPKVVQYFPRVAAAGKGVGLQLEETAGAFAFLTRLTGSNSQAATDFAAAMSKVTKPSKEATDLIKKLNRQGLDLDFTLEALRERGIPDFFQQFEKLDEKQLATIFSSERAREAVKLFISNNEDLRSSIEGVANGQGALEEAYEKRQKSEGEALKRIEAAQERIKIALGDRLLPIIEDALPSIEATAQGFADFIAENKALIPLVLRALLALAALGRLGGAVNDARRFIGLVKDIGGAFSGLAGPGKTAISKLDEFAQKLSAPGKVGLVGAIGLAAFALGSFIDDALGLSDALAEKAAEITGVGAAAAGKVERGTPGFIGSERKQQLRQEIEAEAKQLGISTTALARRREADLRIRRGSSTEEARLILQAAGFTREEVTRQGGGGQDQRVRVEVAVKAAPGTKAEGVRSSEPGTRVTMDQGLGEAF